MRKFLFLTALMCLMTSTIVFGEAKKTNIYVDNKLVQMNGDVQNYRGATYVPLNFVKSGFGATANWTSPNATVKKGDTTLVFTINSNAYINNEKILYSEFQPYMSDGLVYVPLKIVTANLCASVTQDTTTKDLYIDTTKAGSLTNPSIDNDEIFTLSEDGTYGYFIKFYMNNGTNTSVIFVKNMLKQDFTEAYAVKEGFHTIAVWTNDNKLLISNEPFIENNYDIILYDPTSNKQSVIANGHDAIYVQDSNILIYKNNSTFEKLDLSTNTTTTITEQDFEPLQSQQNAINGPGTYYTFYIDDKKLTLDTPPENFGGNLYVPVSFIAKELGFEVTWSNPYITIKNANNTVVLEVNSNAYTKNGVTYYTKYKPYIYNGRTLVPFRFISNLFGYAVTYSEENSYKINRKDVTVKIDTSKKVTPDNSFVDDNSTFILSPNKKYGYKNGGPNGSMFIYVKNMETGEFKEVYSTSTSEYSAWLYNDKLLLRGTYNASRKETGDQFLIYDPTTDTLINLACARYGDYIEELDIFVYSTTEYRSDATSDEGSTFYSKDMKTGKVKTISKDQFYNYLDMEEKYRQSHYTYPY